MKHLFFAIALLAATPAHAAKLYVTEAPASLTSGQSVEWTVSLRPEGGEILTGFGLNVGFSDWLAPSPVNQLGYFASNGIFFFEGILTTNSITFISNALAGGDSLPPGVDPLIKILFTATQDGAPELFLFDPVITTAGGGDALITSIVLIAPVVINAPDGGSSGAAVPEPSTIALVSGTLVAFAIARRRVR